jgi:hypothetical protein
VKTEVKPKEPQQRILKFRSVTNGDLVHSYVPPSIFGMKDDHCCVKLHVAVVALKDDILILQSEIEITSFAKSVSFSVGTFSSFVNLCLGTNVVEIIQRETLLSLCSGANATQREGPSQENFDVRFATWERHCYVHTLESIRVGVKITAGMFPVRLYEHPKEDEFTSLVEYDHEGYPLFVDKESKDLELRFNRFRQLMCRTVKKIFPKTLIVLALKMPAAPKRLRGAFLLWSAGNKIIRGLGLILYRVLSWRRYMAIPTNKDNYNQVIKEARNNVPYLKNLKAARKAVNVIISDAILLRKIIDI